MKSLIQKIHEDDQGQGMAEYTLIIALVAVALVFATRYFGNEIAQVFFRSGEELEKTETFGGYGS